MLKKEYFKEFKFERPVDYIFNIIYKILFIILSLSNKNYKMFQK